ncbi:hypothetical protein [Phreatobacter stygius]|uniref:hypothetical protein n=1 Tax=Phreatobacter stygius TaxID=1940610 RepID=UPI0014770D31|nr:hypothetical protein [Phreatobacter stygius]
MTPETSPLPVMIAPPLAGDASFDIDVAVAYDAEWLAQPMAETPAGTAHPN